MALVKTPAKQPEEKKPDEKRPVVVSFALVQREKLYLALAMKSRGREVVDEKVIESDDYKHVAESALDRASHEYWRHGRDPFEEEA